MSFFSINELTRSETARARKIDNTPPEEARVRLQRLIDRVLDPAREAIGIPIYVNSGYRCPSLNSAVGGVPTSQHTLGEAADLDTRTREGNKKLYAWIAENLEFDQLINENNYSWIHVSYREGRNRNQVLRL